MTLANTLTDYVNAAFTGLWIESRESDEAEKEIVRHAIQEKWRIAIWDVANGLRVLDQDGKFSAGTGGGDPLAALRALPSLAQPDSTAILLVHNFHRFLTSPEIVQTTLSQLVAGKDLRTFVVVLAPVVQIPVELEKVFIVIEHALPNRTQLDQIARETAESEMDLPNDHGLRQVLDAAAGLTRYEAEGAFALSIARHGVIRPDVIWELKAQTFRKNNLLTLHRGKERFANLGGLQSLKDFCVRALTPGPVKPRGLLLLGVPGSGKSCFARALGNETGRPTVTLDMGALYGSLVGQTEANIRQALRTIDAMGPCICFVDEIEKALSGVGGQGDSGVSSRLFGTLLTWLSDHESDVFFIATANDISKLPPEFSRAERFDGVFFIDLPNTKEKDAIWQMYRSQFGVPDNQHRPDDTSWTGAEIRACCRLSALLGVPLTQAARQVVPVAVTAAEAMERLRSWASGRCLDASNATVYSRSGTSKGSRRIARNPDRTSDN